MGFNKTEIEELELKIKELEIKIETRFFSLNIPSIRPGLVHYQLRV
jgi:hypothetical protein